MNTSRRKNADKAHRALRAFILAALIIFMLTPISALAADSQLTLPVQQTFTTDSAAASDTFQYILKPLDAGNPMPSGSAAGGYSFTISGTGAVSIGPIAFSHAGTYRYEMLQVIGVAANGYTYDRQTYTIEIYVTNSLNVITILYDAAGAKTSTLAFVNEYSGGSTPPPPPPPPNPPAPKKWTVIFVDGQGNTLKTERVADGAAATAPKNPTRSGYVFAGWDKSFDKITGDLTVTAKWIPYWGGPTPPAVPPGPVTPQSPPFSPIFGPTTTILTITTTTTPDTGGIASATPDAPATPPTGINPALSPLATSSPFDGSDWSLLSCMMSVAAILSAILLLVFMYFRKKKYEDYEDELDDQGLLTDDRRDELEGLRKKGRLLKALAIIAGVITPIVWLILDWPLHHMVWINHSTPWTALVFIITMALTLAFNIRKRNPEDEDEDKEEPISQNLHKNKAVIQGKNGTLEND